MDKRLENDGQSNEKNKVLTRNQASPAYMMGGAV